jgi:hypothetical protein
MKRNMGVTDRVVRLLLAVAVGVLVGMKIVVGGWAIAVGVVALVFLATSIIGFCPIYEPFGIKTCKVVNRAEVASTQMFDADGDAPSKPKTPA